jgi:DnaJ-class molecular chaperone
MSKPDPYRLLGIEPEATAEEVRAAFRRKVRQNHPDTATEELEDGDVQDIIAAYRLLMDPDARAQHDSDTRRAERGVSGRSVKVTHRGGPNRGSSRTCPTCGGTGTTTEEGRCSECHGRGEITALDRDRARVVRCRQCGGRGRLRVSRRCETCDGSGIRSD